MPSAGGISPCSHTPFGKGVAGADGLGVLHLAQSGHKLGSGNQNLPLAAAVAGECRRAPETLDLRRSGVRNTDAVVLTEASCLVLRYPQSHMRVIGVV